MPGVLIVTIAVFYGFFYLGMGMIMTWAFFWWMLGLAVLGLAMTSVSLTVFQGSGKAAFMLVGVLALGTVLLGGWAREASRPRFVERYSHYDNIYVPEFRQPGLMVEEEGQRQDVESSESGESSEAMAPSREGTPGTPTAPVPEAHDSAARLVAATCTGCHTSKRVDRYHRHDWERVVTRMAGYGATVGEGRPRIVEHLRTARD